MIIMAYEKSDYMKVLKSQPLKDVKIPVSETKQAMINQDKRCAECRKNLKPYYYKFSRDPLTRAIKIICSDCAIKVRK